MADGRPDDDDDMTGDAEASSEAAAADALAAQSTSNDLPAVRAIVPHRSIGGRALIVSACFVIVVAGMKASREILVPFLFSVFIAVLAGPPIAAMKKRGLPTWLAILTVLGVLALGGLFVTAIATRSITSFRQKLPTYTERVEDAKAGFTEWATGAATDLSGWIPFLPDSDRDGVIDGDDLADAVVAEDGEDDGEASEGDDASSGVDGLDGEEDVSLVGGAMRFLAGEAFDPLAVLQKSASLLTEVASVVTNAALILLTVLFLLLESSTLPSKILAISGENGRELLERISAIADDVNHYMALKTIVSALTGMVIAGWLAWLGVDFALLWGLLAFLLNFIPNLGSILAGIPAVLLAWVQLGPTTAGLATLGYVAVNGFVGNVLEPRLLGRGLGLSTLVVFLSLIFWGWVLGAAGMLLSVPLTMACKVALQSSGDLRWIAILLSGDPTKDASLMRDQAGG